MRGARETIAKALALECMRAAREQERDCYVFAFSGPSEVGGGDEHPGTLGGYDREQLGEGWEWFKRVARRGERCNGATCDVGMLPIFHGAGVCVLKVIGCPLRLLLCVPRIGKGGGFHVPWTQSSASV
eukprot:1160151-Pelagomonas_calceolata.AAC.2